MNQSRPRSTPRRLLTGVRYTAAFLIGGALATEILSNAASAGPIVVFSARATNSVGNPVGELYPGDSFRLEVLVRDARQTSLGVYSAFLDISYPESLTNLVGSVTVSPTFPNGRQDSSIGTGQLGEIGGVADSLLPPTNSSLLISANFQAVAPGELLFELSPADLVHHEVSLFGRDTALRTTEVAYESLTLQIVPEPSGLLLTLTFLVPSLRNRSRRR